MMGPKEFGRVAVLMGGSSAERDISLMSGRAVLAALRSSGIDAMAFDPAERSLCELPAEGIARAFIALHGRGGEDGSVQGMLDVLGIAYTGSGILASALALDKWRAKLVWQAAGLSTPACRLLEGGIEPAQIVAELGLPLFVKPAREGSSLGAARVDTATELSTAYAAAARRDRLVLVERFIGGTEVTVPFLADKALPVVRIEAPDGLYDYQNKYFSDATRYLCPSGLPDEMEKTLQSVTLQAARLLGCRGWGRADLIVDDEGEAWLLEINTAPGMTGHSLVPMSAAAAGIDFPSLCCLILETARHGD